MSDRRRRWWLVLLLLGAVVAVWTAWSIRAMQHARELATVRKALQGEERERARAEGLLATTLHRSAALETEVRTATGRSTALAAEVARLRRAFPGARPTEVSTRTSEGIVVGRDRLCPDSFPPVDGPSPRRVDPAPPPVTLEVRTREVRATTDAGTTVAAGVAELWRIEPPPPELLGEAPWSAALSTTDTLAPAQPKRGPPWAVEATVTAWTDSRVAVDAALFLRGGRWAPVLAGSYGFDESSVYVPSAESYQAATPWEAGVGIRWRLGPGR